MNICGSQIQFSLIYDFLRVGGQLSHQHAWNHYVSCTPEERAILETRGIGRAPFDRVPCIEGRFSLLITAIKALIS